MYIGAVDWGIVDWIQLAQDRDRWRAVVNTMMNFRILAPRSYFFIYGVNGALLMFLFTQW
jgi:hypothetical protein